MEERAPREHAEDWDNVGLLLGDPQLEVEGAVVSVDLCVEAVDLARKQGANLLVTHHPVIFSFAERSFFSDGGSTDGSRSASPYLFMYS